MAIASDMLVLNFTAAEATISGRKKNAPSPMTVRMVSVAILFQHAGHLEDHRQQLDHRSADDRRDQRRHGADQRVEDPAPMRFSVSGGLPCGSAGCILAGSRLTTSRYACETVLPMITWHWLSLRTAEHASQAFQRRAVDLRSSLTTKRKRVIQWVTAVMLSTPPEPSQSSASAA
jgi:hypothetical protein